jgi:hypothetical protein
MDSNFDLIGILKICAVVMVPFMVGVIWLLPKFLNSKTRTKVVAGAVIGSVFMVGLVGLVNYSGIPVKNGWLTVVLTAIIWGIGGFLVGVYFDVRLLGEPGLNYFQKYGQSAYALGYGIIGVVISLPLGVISGWIVMTMELSFVESGLSGIVGAVYGGLLGWLLNKVIER